MKTTKQFISSLLLFCFSLSVYAIDWSKIEGKQVTLFYPGQSSLEWILTKSDHGGAKNVRKGKDCRECHQDEEKEMGNLIVSGKKLEPDPIPNKRGHIDAIVKTAYDASKFYIQLSWKETGTAVTNKMARDQSKVTILFDDGSVSAIKRAGCWAACHDDATHMQSAVHGEKLGLYLSKSRTKITRNGGGRNYKPDQEIQQLLTNNFFVEYWQAKLNQDKTAKVIDAYILDKRHEHKSPKVGATSKLINDLWTVELSRELLPNEATYKNIKPGNVYNFGLAIHDEFSHGRHHHVSFRHTFALDKGNADFIAIKQ